MVWLSAGLLMLTGPAAMAQSFSLDDNPTLGGRGIGFGAEDQFGLTPGPGLAPSPSQFPLISGDGTLVSPAIGGLQHAPNGRSMDAYSTNKFRPAILSQPFIRLDFSVDRLTTGLPGSASLVESTFDQQPGDIYTTTAAFINPIAFVGTLGPGPFVGLLPSAGVGGSNVLTIDESAFGLVTAAGIIPPAPAFGGPIFTGSHDNVDAFDWDKLVPAGAPVLGVSPSHAYFSIDPAEGFAVGASAASIFDVPAFAPGTPPIPFAPSFALGLDTFGFNTDSVDALIMFDGSLLGGPAFGGPGAEPARDFALFSLAPGSASLTAFGLSAGHIFFTDFTGSFAIYALDTDLGLLPGAPGFPFQNHTNVDALSVVPEPTSLALIAIGAGLMSRRRRRS